jgi:hypothetical protein
MYITRVLLMVSFPCLLLIEGCTSNPTPKDSGDLTRKTLIRVPEDYLTIAQAVVMARSGDTIIIAPGNYSEFKIRLYKPLTISSEWILNGDRQFIDKTCIDARDSILFLVESDNVEISGLKIINGDHTISASAELKLLYNHFTDNLDAMSCESGSGGYIGFNTVEDDKDDGLDIDIGADKNNVGSDIIIENNSIINSHDDGIEIRLFTKPDQNIKYTIRNNNISGSRNAGIQLISYDVYTGKEFHIHHNFLSGCKTGLGCMEGSNTDEDMSGASKMDEFVYFYNNTVVNNQMGATGGNRMIAFNNLVTNNSAGGFKRFGQYSVVKNNLFFNNAGSDMVEFNNMLIKSGNILSADPMINSSTYAPLAYSPCINAGLARIAIAGAADLEVSTEYISGTAPDIGAVELMQGK